MKIKNLLLVAFVAIGIGIFTSCCVRVQEERLLSWDVEITYLNGDVIEHELEMTTSYDVKLELTDSECLVASWETEEGLVSNEVACGVRSFNIIDSEDANEPKQEKKPKIYKQ